MKKISMVGFLLSLLVFGLAELTSPMKVGMWDGVDLATDEPIGGPIVCYGLTQYLCDEVEAGQQPEYKIDDLKPVQAGLEWGLILAISLGVGWGVGRIFNKRKS